MERKAKGRAPEDLAKAHIEAKLLEADLFERYFVLRENLDAFLAVEDSGWADYETRNAALLEEERQLEELFQAHEKKLEELLTELQSFNLEKPAPPQDAARAKFLLEESDLLEEERQALNKRLSEFELACQGHEAIGKEHDNKKAAFERDCLEITSKMVGLCREMFKSTDNPVYIWLAISFCREFQVGLPIPDWCLEYITDCADGIRLLIGEEKLPDTGDVAKVFGFSRAGTNAFATVKTDMKHYRMSALVKLGTLSGIGRNQMIKDLSDWAGMEPRSLQRILAKSRSWVEPPKEDDLTLV